MNGSYLLLSILAANHAAARSDTSLPYLTQTAPEALRFDVRRTLGPPPVRPGAATQDATLVPESAPAPDASPATQPVSSAPPPGDDLALPDIAGTPAQSATPPPPVGHALVPDIYAPPPPPVTIDELLPFFLPASTPAAPPSRATYELK